MRIGSPIPHKKSRIEIIPLIDIMFFLLASFMMVSLQMNKMQTIKVNLPTATMAKQDFKPDMVNLAVDKLGDVYLEKKPITLNELHMFLTNKFAANTNLPVYISGDKETTHGSMVYVLDFVRRAGIQRVAFAVQAAGGTEKK